MVFLLRVEAESVGKRGLGERLGRPMAVGEVFD